MNNRLCVTEVALPRTLPKLGRMINWAGWTIEEICRHQRLIPKINITFELGHSITKGRLSVS